MTQSPNGTCSLCGHEAPKAQMTRHLAACLPNHDSGAGDETLVHLLIEATNDPDYWLHVEGRAAASLEQLDRLLRDTWLECCGHMSAFYVQGVEPAMRSRLDSVFRAKGMLFKYEYDFGSTTRLKGKVVGFRSIHPPHLHLQPSVAWTLLCHASSFSRSEPRLGFVFLGPELCRGLPSDTTSRWTPPAFAGAGPCRELGLLLPSPFGSFTL